MKPGCGRFLVGILVIFVLIVVVGQIFRSDAPREASTSDPNRSTPAADPSIDSSSSAGSGIGDSTENRVSAAQITVLPESVYDDLKLVAAHHAALVSFLMDIRGKVDSLPDDEACRAALTKAIAAVCDEAKSVRNDLPKGIPEEVVTLADRFITVFVREAESVRDKEPDYDALAEFGATFDRQFKRQGDEKLQSVPIELTSWTEERIKQFLNFPSTAKFGWFPSVRAAKDNRSAVVMGSFRASNAFGLETKHEFKADWAVSDSSSESQIWSLILLSIDGETAYVNPEFEAKFRESLSGAIEVGQRWKTRRDKVASAIAAVDEAVAKWRRDDESEKARVAQWHAESHVFTSDAGTTLRARVKSSMGPAGTRIVTLEREDGTLVRVAENRLADQDRKFIDDWFKSRRN